MDTRSTKYLIFLVSAVLSILFSAHYFLQDQLIVYGDAESHLNIAKRVIHSLTPGMAQLGGVWLPLPHLLLVPFVSIDTLWRTGLAGSIVSGASYIISGLYIFNIVYLLTKKQIAAAIGAALFLLNPNILYMQSTAMTELPLIALFLLSIYYFSEYIMNGNKIEPLLLSSLFGFAATLTRYDGWFLVAFQALGLLIYHGYKYLRQRSPALLQKTIGLLTLYSTLAFFGIILWFLWGWVILGDPLYFTSSPFSAKSQQRGWLSRGELPSYHNIASSIEYYTVTSIENIGSIASILFTLGLLLFALDRKIPHRFIFLMILLVPYTFYVVTLYLGQSVIFIPQLTPDTFEWQIFNVRYGLMMVPPAAIIVAYFFHRSRFLVNKLVIIALVIIQYGLFMNGTLPAISKVDGIEGLSGSKRTDAERWLRENYDGGLVLIDDFARTVSVVRSTVPMQNIIYIGNKPYWEESLETPEKHADWIILQENDTLWNALIQDSDKEGRLYTHFVKSYTSPNILIFRRMDQAASAVSTADSFQSSE
jgi:hypothetical protein